MKTKVDRSVYLNSKTLEETCKQLGLKVSRVPAHGTVRSFNAIASGVRVYWTACQDSEFLIGAPRIATVTGDTHIRTIKELCFLVKLSFL